MMKKNVLRALILVLYLLISCTALSQKIEKEMATQAEIVERRPIGGSTSSVTLEPMFYEDGVGFLYEVTEGTGWNSGLRTTRIPPERWGYEEFGRFVRFVGGRNYLFVSTASRTPIQGGLVEVVKAFEAGADQYLVYCPEGIPEDLALPETWRITDRTGNALLVDVSDGTFPFFQHRAKLLAGIPKAESSRIISLTEAEMFLEVLPKAAAVFAAYAAGLVFWGAGCLASVHLDDNKVLIWFNGTLALAALGCMIAMLKEVDLPASMLPVDNIFQWEHYQEEFMLMFGTLESMGNTGILNISDSIRMQCFTVFQYSCFGILMIMLTQMGFVHIRKWLKGRKRYVGKYLMR